MRFAADLAVALGVELIVVHALGLTTAGFDWHDPPDERRRWVSSQLDGAWTEFIDRDQVSLRTAVVDGADAMALMRVADEEDASLIVVGSHGSGRSGNSFLGSTSHRIVADSHRPVLVVPPGDNHPHRRSGAGAMSTGVADAE